MCIIPFFWVCNIPNYHCWVLKYGKFLITQTNEIKKGEKLCQISCSFSNNYFSNDKSHRAIDFQLEGSFTVPDSKCVLNRISGSILRRVLLSNLPSYINWEWMWRMSVSLRLLLMFLSRLHLTFYFYVYTVFPSIVF